MSVFAEIVSGLVTQVAVYSGAGPAGWIQLDGLTPQPGIGWSYNGSVFAPPAMTKPQLAAYAQSKQSAIAGGGITVNVGSSGSPVNVEASTDVGSLVLLQGAASIAAANPSQTFQWVPETGSPITLTAAQITTMFAAVSAFIQSTFTTLAGVVAAITAGTITTTAQVDTPPSPIPAWPVNS